MNNQREYYKFLTHLGKSLKVTSEDRELHHKLFTGGWSSHFWNGGLDVDELSRLNDDEIIFLLKGVVVAENERFLSGGSPTCGIQIYQHIQVRENIVQNGQLAMITDWVLRHAKNRYIPFGFSNRGNNLIDHVRREEQYSFSKREESLNSKINKLNKRFKGFENKISQLEKEKLYLNSVLGEFNEKDILAAKERVISNKKKN